ncbi:pyridoxal phosphate-dependent transferase [Lyophyllum atratum]|nr:pyridoxal phosphate-dependent transferase [Lyophyllum atratum]
MSYEKRPDADDLSHHLSRVSRARATSPLKGLQKYFGKPGVISLAGGLPHPDYFPFSSVGADALVPSAFPLAAPKEASSLTWFWNLFSGRKVKTSPIQIPKYPANPGELNLAEALQYSMATGIPSLQSFFKEFTERVYQPAYANYTTLAHIGNTDGWAKVVLTLCNPGEGVLAAEFTYPSAVSMMLPYDIKVVSVPMDGHGMKADALRTLLSEWDETLRAMPRPHVMYTIPVGQNPTGITMQAARKREIYDVCVEFDIIIVEDDPYYFLQAGAYVPPAERSIHSNFVADDDDEYIAQLAPSYLRFDHQGRVIRLDTFSKTIAPGCRMGWFTCNSMFAERLERQAETTTQSPCGFSQIFVAKLMQEWQFKGYVRWLKALRVQYQQRRDFFIDCLHEQFNLELSMNATGALQGIPVYVASLKSTMNLSPHAPVFSFTPPTAGMFIWLNLTFDHHPSFAAVGHEALEMKLWIALAEAGVLFGPGYMFATDPEASDRKHTGHFRISYSNAEYEDMRKAIIIFSSILKDFYNTMSY